jgi:hypothetical protein
VKITQVSGTEVKFPDEDKTISGKDGKPINNTLVSETSHATRKTAIL